MNRIHEHEIRTFLREAPKKPYKRWALFTCSGIAAAIAAFFLSQIFVLGTGDLPVLDFTQISQAASSVSPVTSPTPVAAPSSTPTPTTTATPAPVTLPENTLSISDLSISAPISWNVSNDSKTMTSALQVGLAHIAGTPLPGQTGMAAISGHSSNYVWAKGDYNHIFSKLPKISTGTIIEINYNNTMYAYKVVKKYEVSPSKSDVLNDNSTNGIRLITCTPVGTSLRRLIVEAVLVTP